MLVTGMAFECKREEREEKREEERREGGREGVRKEGREGGGTGRKITKHPHCWGSSRMMGRVHWGQVAGQGSGPSHQDP